MPCQKVKRSIGHGVDKMKQNAYKLISNIIMKHTFMHYYSRIWITETGRIAQHMVFPTGICTSHEYRKKFERYKFEKGIFEFHKARGGAAYLFLSFPIFVCSQNCQNPLRRNLREHRQ